MFDLCHWSVFGRDTAACEATYVSEESARRIIDEEQIALTVMPMIVGPTAKAHLRTL